MERKNGETFEYKGKTFKVKEGENGSCHGCFFDGHCYDCRKHIAGNCSASGRSDNIDVIFVEVKDEQPQEEQPQELNLCEVLKYCPEGETFWSPLLGDVKLHFIDKEAKRVVVTLTSGATCEIHADATISIGRVISPEIMLYPSKEQRDWSKFTAPWYKKKKFDPKTLSPFDGVLGRNHSSHKWTCDLFSDIIVGDECMYNCTGSYYRYCIPYNDDTKHLVGTIDEAPKFYRYWED